MFYIGINIGLTATKVAVFNEQNLQENFVMLAGGLLGNAYILTSLSEKLVKEVSANKLSRYAGAIGAALMASKL